MNDTAPRRANYPGTPRPQGFWRRLRQHPAHRHVTIREAAYNVTRIGVYYAKTLFVTKLWPAAWRNKDRTVLAAVPLTLLLAGPLWCLPAGALAGLGWLRLHPRCQRTRITRHEGSRLRKAVVVAPKVLDTRDCHAPVREPLPRGEVVRIGKLAIHSATLARALDRLRPRALRPELISRYCDLRLPPNIDPDAYVKLTGVIAATYDQDLTFDRSAGTPARASMRIEYVDWLARIVPWAREEYGSPYRLPIGMDRDARWRYDSIADQAWLIGGVRGSGKTAFVRGICGRLHDVPGVELWIGDHRKDLSDFDGKVTRYAATVEGTLTLLEQFVAAHNDAELYKDRHRLKWLAWPEQPCRVLVLDELGALTTHPDREVREAVERALYLIATQGRKTMHSLLAATQHPDATHLPTSIRGQFTRRLGLRVNDRRESEMVMGHNRCNLTAIPHTHKGRGWWQGEGPAVQLRTPGLYDHDLSWLLGSGPGGERSREQHEQELSPLPVVAESAPTNGLHLVPALTENREDTFKRVLAAAPPHGLTIEDLHTLTDIPKPTLYRMVQLAYVEQVRHQKPRTFRLRRAA